MKRFLKTGMLLLASLIFGFIGGILGNNLSQEKTNTPVTPTNQEPVVIKNETQNTNSTTQAVQKVQDAVVSVLNYKSDGSGTNPYSIFNNRNNSDNELVIHSKGSGIIYKKNDDSAFLVTNTHVVAGAEKIEIQLANGSIIEGSLVGADTYSDIAVVKIAADKVTTVAEFGDTSNLNVGETAIAIGSPLGTEYANSVTQGIISSLSRTVVSQSEDGQTISTNAIQTDAAINPGNSGGPLINIQGQVIGITSSKISSKPTGLGTNVSIEGIGFAIPVNDALAIINQLEEKGRVTRPALGIQMANLTDLSIRDLQELELPEDITAGIIVVSIKDGLAAEGHLEQYDVITKIDDVELLSSSDLQSVLYSKTIGDSIEVTFYRKGEKMTRQIELTSSTEDLQ